MDSKLVLGPYYSTIDFRSYPLMCFPARSATGYVKKRA